MCTCTVYNILSCTAILGKNAKRSKIRIRLVYMHQLNFEPFIHQTNQLTNQGFSQGDLFFLVRQGKGR